ncbi:MAG: hypothetical protein H0U95_10945 [Bacteroidetes bacterium]|nr:hypothetical protein [Bacteroidota bacterium]
MKNKFKQALLLGAFFTAFSICGVAQQSNCIVASKVIKGKYNGKNLLFENQATNGIQKIYINDKEVVSNATSVTKAYELKLSDLKMGQAFDLKIVFCEMVPTPFKILNPDDIK